MSHSKNKPVEHHKYLVGFKENPLKWVRNTAVILIFAFALSHPLMKLVMEVYDLLTQNPTVKPRWDHLINWQYWPIVRHMARDGYEGLMVAATLAVVRYNAFKQRKTKLNFVDRLEIRLHISNIKQPGLLTKKQALAALPLAFFVYALPGFAGTVFVVALVQAHAAAIHAVTAAGTHNVAAVVAQHHIAATGELAKIKSGFMGYLHTWWISDWYLKLGGMVASFLFFRRPMKMVYHTIHMHFAFWRAPKAKPIKWYFPAAVKELIEHVRANPAAPDPRPHLVAA